jgi:hypothetical protein
MKRRPIELGNFIFVLLKKKGTATPVFSNQHPDQSATIDLNIRPVDKKIEML